MRYDSPDHHASVLIRRGAVAIYHLSSRRFSRFRRLDPALIGKTIHELSGYTVGAQGLDRIEESRGDLDFLAMVGATNILDDQRTTGTVSVSSDGNECWLWISHPVEDEGQSADVLRSMPVLSSRPPIHVPNDAEWSSNSRLIPPWRDPEMLGQAMLDGIRLIKPPFTPGVSSVLEREEPRRRTAAHRAARDGDVSAIPAKRRFLSPSVDRGDAAGITPMMIAAEHGHVDVMERLLALGGSVGRRDDEGCTPLHFAVRGGSQSALRTLLNAGADPSTRDRYGQTPLHEAVRGGVPEVLQALLDAGASPNCHDSIYASTPLHEAARGDHVRMIPLLLGAGADIDALNERGRTPLHVAASYGHAGALEALLDAGGDVNSRDRDGQTPLHGPVFFQHLDCIALLIRRGGDVSVDDTVGNTPLHVAAGMNRDAAAELLLDTGADIEPVNREGLTPLDMAIINHHDRDFYRTHIVPYMRIQDEHNSEVAELLIDRGAGIDPDRLPVGDRHILWPHLTPGELMHRTGDLDYDRLVGPTSSSQIRQRLIWEFREGTSGPPPLAKVASSFSLLHDAVLKEMPGLVEALLDSGVSPQTAVRLLATPLHVAAVVGNLEIAETLLDRGADIEMPRCNATDGRFDTVGWGRAGNGMQTPLDSAVEAGQVEMARYLLLRGAKPYPPETRSLVEANTTNEFGAFRPIGPRTELIDKCPRDRLKKMTEVFEEFGITT